MFSLCLFPFAFYLVPLPSRRLLPLLVLVASAGYICRVAPSSVAPQIMQEFGLSQTEMGTVFSAFLLGYTFMQMPSGWLADRITTRRLFAVISVAWLVLTLATAAARPIGPLGAV